MRKETKALVIAFGAAILTVAAPARPESDGETPVVPRPYYGRIAQRLSAMLPKCHVLQRALDDEISRRAWTNLVTTYDFDHSVFLKSDLDRLAAHETTIDDELAAGDVSFGYEVHGLYVRRLRERLLFATNLLSKAAWDFSVDESYRIRRKDASWPETTAEAEEHWRKRMKNEVLAIRINRELDAEEAAQKRRRGAIDAESTVVTQRTAVAASPVGTAEPVPAETDGAADESADTPEQSLLKKYRQYAIVLTEPDEEAVLQHYLSAVARAYDPHTDYMSPTSKEDFDMDMNLTLCGVGAVLSMDDGALKINEVMPGGPMDVDGRIKEGDKIVGVQQADGAMEDVMWQPMHKTIRKIRGPKGTRVTLEIVPRADPSGATKKRIELVRDEIRLEDQAATGRVERVELGGVTRRLGYIYLPGFYGTMDKRMSDPGFRSCAQDVARYLGDFNQKDVEGLVLDLRGNGGGSLREAVLLSALFVHAGPVVQIRDTRAVGALPIPYGNPVAFRKPMVVLTDRASASASEIVAGHLRDVGRAIVIGDSRTHGKGTVQTVLGLGPEKYGSTKITTARFYRITGRSTQVEGVPADIVLPSLLESMDLGEDKLPNALPFSRVPPADFGRSWNLDGSLPVLRARSKARLDASARYAKHLENVAGMRRIVDREEVPLAFGARKALAKADRELHELDAEGDGGDDEGEGEKKKPSRRRRNERAKDDVVLDEAFLVLADLVGLRDGEELPQPKGWWE